MESRSDRVEPAGFNARLDELMHKAAHEMDWARFDMLMTEAAAASHPYPVHAYAAGCLVDRIATDILAERAYLLWAWLGDHWDLGDQGRRDETEQLMRTAAAEWLALPDTEAARLEYLVRWHDKVGPDSAELAE